MRGVDDAQARTCKRFGVAPLPALPELKVGISRGAGTDDTPLHGLRHPPEGDTTGWYIWSGDYSDSPDFFEPLHVMHLRDRSPLVLPYLSLPPGWRFLIAPAHEEVWYDDSLLDV